MIRGNYDLTYCDIEYSDYLKGFFIHDRTNGYRLFVQSETLNQNIVNNNLIPSNEFID